MQAKDVSSFIETLAPVESGIPGDENGYIFGDSDVEISGIGVTWMPTTPTLRKAASEGLNMMVVHEALFYNEQRSPWYDEPKTWAKLVNRNRIKVLLDNKMCVYRCHSNWDACPKYGVVDAIAERLGFAKELGRSKFTRVYEIDPVSLEEFAETVRRRLDIPTVRYIGDPKTVITRVAPLVGGFGGNQFNMPEMVLSMGAEAIILGDMVEYIAVHARELGLAVIETLHSTTENIGIQNLARLLAERFPSTNVKFINSGAYSF